MAEQPQQPQPDFTEILANVPNIGTLRIDATINSLRVQRDSASNSAVTLAAELEVFKKATDYYHQMALGLQAQFTLVRAALDENVATIANHVQQNEQLNAKVARKQAVIEDLVARLTALEEHVNSAGSLKDLRVSSKAYFAVLSEQNFGDEEVPDNPSTTETPNPSEELNSEEHWT